MEYRILKEISLLTLAQAGPKGCCEFMDEYHDLVARMSTSGFAVFSLKTGKESTPGLNIFIRWIKEKTKRIQWLIDKGFIEKVDPEMLPCPFCGGKVEVVNWDGDYWTECSGHPCPSRSHYRTKADATDAWNRRA